MKTYVLLVVTVCVFASISLSAGAVESNKQMIGHVSSNSPTTFALIKRNIKKISITGTDYDRIQFFITDDQGKTFRFPFLTQTEAEKILEKIKNGKPLVFQTEPVKNKKYLDVIKWE